ncbi:MAG: hypothetical protein LUG95_08415 [Clostridiales bacterium]|nr:hypothetical protein [Clostridiales bacterium]
MFTRKSPYPKTHNLEYFKRVCELLNIVFEDKSTPLCEWIHRDTFDNLIKNPDSLPEPWYGQLMRVPQIATYIFQIYIWIKDNNVEFEI